MLKGVPKEVREQIRTFELSSKERKLLHDEYCECPMFGEFNVDLPMPISIQVLS